MRFAEQGRQPERPMASVLNSKSVGGRPVTAVVSRNGEEIEQEGFDFRVCSRLANWMARLVRTQSLNSPLSSTAMARTKKGTNRIVVRQTEYRWIVRVYWGKISVLIWPSNNFGPTISCDAIFDDSAELPMVVTNRLIRRVVDYAVDSAGYNADEVGEPLFICDIVQKVDWSDAIRTKPGG